MVIPPEHAVYGIINAFSRFSNLIPCFIDPWQRRHQFHRIIGRAAYKLDVNSRQFRFLQIITNPPHKLGNLYKGNPVVNLKPEEIDLIVVCDPIVCNIDFREFPNAKKVYWGQDSMYPWVFNTQSSGMKIDSYDFVFTMTSEHARAFREYTNARCDWLPPYFNPEIHKFTNSEKEYDLCFIGNVTSSYKASDEKRRVIIDSLKKAFPNRKLFFGTAWQHDMVGIVNRSKIVLNISRNGNLNLRDFETLGCGQFLLRDKSNEVLELFKDNYHLATYGDNDHLINLVQYFLDNIDERERIRSNGHLEALNKHTIFHRVQFILDSVFG